MAKLYVDKNDILLLMNAVVYTYNHTENQLFKEQIDERDMTHRLEQAYREELPDA